MILICFSCWGGMATQDVSERLDIRQQVSQSINDGSKDKSPKVNLFPEEAYKSSWYEGCLFWPKLIGVKSQRKAVVVSVHKNQKRILLPFSMKFQKPKNVTKAQWNKKVVDAFVRPQNFSRLILPKINISPQKKKYLFEIQNMAYQHVRSNIFRLFGQFTIDLMLLKVKDQYDINFSGESRTKAYLECASLSKSFVKQIGAFKLRIEPEEQLFSLFFSEAKIFEKKNGVEIRGYFYVQPKQILQPFLNEADLEYEIRSRLYQVYKNFKGI